MTTGGGKNWNCWWARLGSNQGPADSHSCWFLNSVDYIITLDFTLGYGALIWLLRGLHLSSSLCTFRKCTFGLAQDCLRLYVKVSLNSPHSHPEISLRWHHWAFFRWFQKYILGDVPHDGSCHKEGHIFQLHFLVSQVNCYWNFLNLVSILFHLVPCGENAKRQDFSCNRKLHSIHLSYKRIQVSFSTPLKFGNDRYSFVLLLGGSDVSVCKNYCNTFSLSQWVL